ncbi:TetR/AcrR family transcriptional regulator [Fictibacillus fluitans]|uniref:TetR/AcrR family transcriptional regulator n=1 Tax=Fictibacillus fluitans TaxID=3058422 RepID=A0ABT8I050_9BACL|nr:TetR/AcrR family transcriptional regulator [Fictibacillus sp. NE201]MDN4526406.1 TetR/AcrR family transcriptional regulator [Fictibacillus sp. NE201]
MLSKKRESLLENAERLFYENGFHAIGMKRVISESDVALMTMYNHFDSKEDLILEVLKRREERYFSFLKTSISENKNIALSLTEAHMNWILENGSNGCMMLRAKEEYSSTNKEISDTVIAHKKNLISFLQDNAFNVNQATRLAMLFEGATALSEVLEPEAVSKELLDTIQYLFHE